MARVPVPTKPELEREDYTLGGSPEWMNEFARGTDASRADADALGRQGQGLNQQSLAVQNRQGPATNYGRSQAFGGQQVGAANWLQDFANGPQGPSAAQAQLQQGANQSMRQSLALARSGSGFGEEAADIASAQRANADTMANASNQAAILRAQEDQAFRQQQMQAMSGAADIYGATAAREGGQAEFGTNAAMEQQRIRDAMQLGLGQQSIDAQSAGIQGQLDASGQNLDAQRAALEGRAAMGTQAGQNYATENEVFKEQLRRDEAQREARRKDRSEGASLIGTAVGAAASLFSDARTKRNVRAASLRGRYEALSD